LSPAPDPRQCGVFQLPVHQQTIRFYNLL
jgi:hypothetical protein